MGLMKRFILSDLDEMANNNIRLKIIGNFKCFRRAMLSSLIEGALARTAGQYGHDYRGRAQLRFDG